MTDDVPAPINVTETPTVELRPYPRPSATAYSITRKTTQKVADGHVTLIDKLRR